MSFFNSSTAVNQPIIREAVLEMERQNYAGARILPFVPKQSITGRFPVIAARNFKNQSSAERANGASSKRIDFEYSTSTFEAIDYSVETGVTDRDIREMQDDGLDEYVSIMGNECADDLLLQHDIRVAALLAAAGFNSTAKSGGSYDNASTAKPLTDVKLAVQRLKNKGYKRNVNLIIESSLWTEICLTDDLRQINNGSGILSLSEEQIASIFGVAGIIICDSQKNTAAKGKAESLSAVYPTDKFYVASLAGGSFNGGGIGRTVIDTRLAQAPFGISTYRNEELKEGIVRAEHSVDELIINSKAAEEVTGV